MRELQFYDKEDRPWPGYRLDKTSIIGHTTETTVKLWIRTKQEGKYWLLVSDKKFRRDGKVRAVKSTGSSKFHAELTLADGSVLELPGVLKNKDTRFLTDCTAVFNLKGLKSGTVYHYAVFSDDTSRTESWEVGRDEDLTFRTQVHKPNQVCFGLYSCHMPFKGREVLNLDMWESFGWVLKNANADFVIAAGDQVYTDGDKNVSIWRWLKKVKKEVVKLPEKQKIEVMTSWFRDIYRGYWGDLALRRIFRSYPTYMIWDDHEIMDGWGSYTRTELSNELDTMWEWENQGKNVAIANKMFAAAKIVYDEYQHSHNPTTPKGQFDYEFDWQDLAFFVMDMRGVRNYSRKTNKILGKDQLARFKKWLKSPSATNASVLYIVSPVPVIHVSDFVANHLDLPLLGLADDLRDEWEHNSNWDERNEILKLIFSVSESRNQKVVFLSGDVHIGAAFKLTRQSNPKAQVYQLTSSGITYCKSPGKLLKLAIKKKGFLGNKKTIAKSQKTSFQMLHVFEENNFATITTKKNDDESTSVFWDLYGNTGNEGEIIHLKQLSL